ncbi:MAG: lactonase family protein [Pseudonocardiaceae bacterium]
MTAATEHKTTHQGKTGIVYALNNQETGNSVTVFDRAADGGLTRMGTFPTGGLGTGNGRSLATAADPLTSQGALALSADQRFLFALDAGSNEISSLAIQDTTLVAVGRVPSGGALPTSVTVHQNLLYVVHQTDGTIAGFTVANDGKLSPIAGSNQTLIGGPNADPGQIQFTPDGTGLVVTETANNVIDVFPVGPDGRASAPVNNPSNGAGPFGFAFVGEDVIVVSEATANATSSYRVAGDGTIKVISGSVPAEQAACWASINSVTNPRYAYVSNAISGTISGYRIDSDRALTPLSPDGHSAVLRDSRAALDSAVSSDDRFLYVLTAGFSATNAAPIFCSKMGISAFRIETNGSLTPLRGFGIADDDLDGLPPGAQEILAT